MLLKLFRLLFALCVFTASQFAHGKENLDIIPIKFHGNWASDISHCNSIHSSNLEITATKLNFWESVGSTLAIVTHNKNKLALILDLKGEGDEWIAFYHFELSADGTQLFDIENVSSGDRFIRYRCPG